MRRIFSMLCMAAAMWACTDSESLRVPESDSLETTVLNAKRTPEEAGACALDAFNTFYGSSRSLVMIKDVKCVTSNRMSRSAAGDTLYYVVNTEDNAGYAVIAADRNIEPVLAVTESGNVDDVDDIENPGAALYFDMLADYFELNRDVKPIDSTTIVIPMYPVDPTKEHRRRTEYKTSKKGPHAPYAWGQGFPENYYMPNDYAGCGNVASMLVMSCFEEPTTYPANDIMNFQVMWSVIKRHTASTGWTDECGSGIDSYEHEKIASLCFAIAEQNKSKYERNGTATVIDNVHNMFKKRVGNLNISDIREGMPAYGEVDKEMIYVRATSTNGEGHAFVIDGKMVLTSTLYVEEREIGSNIWTVVSSESSSSRYNHINWGWNGLDNGYFTFYLFDTTKGYEYDGTHSDSTPDFKTSFRYFCVTKS